MTMNFAQQEKLRMLDNFTESVKSGKESLSSVAKMLGETFANAVKERLDAQGHKAASAAASAISAISTDGLSSQQFYALIQRMQRDYFSNQSTQGNRPQQVSQQDHNCIVDNIFDSVNAGTKPAVRPMLEAYAREHNRAPEWAERAAAQTHPKKMGKTLAAKKDHPVLQNLKDGSMLSQTHKSTLQNATYSGLAELLFSGSQNVRSQRALQAEVHELRTRMTAVEAEAARANTRLDESEQWRAEAEEMYRAGASYGCITKATTKGKTTVYEHIQAAIKAGRLNVRTSVK